MNLNRHIAPLYGVFMVKEERLPLCNSPSLWGWMLVKFKLLAENYDKGSSICYVKGILLFSPSRSFLVSSGGPLRVT